MQKNWFGENPHPTDDYIHWKDQGKQRIKKIQTLRAAYDKLAAVDKEALELLLQASYDSGSRDGWEDGYSQGAPLD